MLKRKNTVRQRRMSAIYFPHSQRTKATTLLFLEVSAFIGIKESGHLKEVTDHKEGLYYEWKIGLCHLCKNLWTL
jgi:hypothetical protein